MTREKNEYSVSRRKFLGVGSAAIGATMIAAATAAAQITEDTEKAELDRSGSSLQPNASSNRVKLSGIAGASVLIAIGRVFNQMAKTLYQHWRSHYRVASQTDDSRLTSAQTNRISANTITNRPLLCNDTTKSAPATAPTRKLSQIGARTWIAASDEGLVDSALGPCFGKQCWKTFCISVVTIPVV